jgi:hypothetical protein
MPENERPGFSHFAPLTEIQGADVNREVIQGMAMAADYMKRSMPSADEVDRIKGQIQDNLADLKEIKWGGNVRGCLVSSLCRAHLFVAARRMHELWWGFLLKGRNGKKLRATRESNRHGEREQEREKTDQTAWSGGRAKEREREGREMIWREISHGEKMGCDGSRQLEIGKSQRKMHAHTGAEGEKKRKWGSGNRHGQAHTHTNNGKARDTEKDRQRETQRKAGGDRGRGTGTHKNDSHRDRESR